MLLYLVVPESSRTFCCKVYKLISVVFLWFLVFGELSRESVVFTEVLTEVVYLLKCNREVTWISGKSYGSPSVFTNLAWACCEVLWGIAAFVWNKYSCCVSDIPEFWLETNFLPLKTFELATQLTSENCSLVFPGKYSGPRYNEVSRYQKKCSL